jgi:hypothetical protein
MRCNFTHVALLTGAMMILSPILFAAPSNAKDESAKGARLLKSVAADARQIRMAASEFENLTKDSSATWRQYDRQWNEIQPAVETMRMKIGRLEAMGSSLSAAQKQALERSKADCQKIVWQSRELGKLVDTVPANLSTPKFKIESRDLVKEASDIAHAVKTGV